MTDEMPINFGIKYIFWMTLRWVYFNPLTILFILQGWAVELAVSYPDVKWVSHVASGIGIVVAQIRNRNKDYTVPIGNKPDKPNPPDSSTDVPETP